MKTASPALAALVAGGEFYCCTLYAFETTVGLTVNLTTADFDVWDGATRFHCGATGSGYPRIDSSRSRAKGRWKRGLDSDSWTVTILPSVQDPFSVTYTYPDVVGSTPWLAACRAGFFDAARTSIRRAYFAAPPAAPITRAAATCVGSLSLFSGVVDAVECEQTTSVFTIADMKSLLSVQMPRNLYQASCRNQLFDAQCGLVAAVYAQGGTALAGSTRVTVVGSAPGPGGVRTWQLGRMIFTSGANAGLQRTIAAWDGAQQFTMQSPFPFAVAAGDAFTVWPGCNKDLGTCRNAFANDAAYNGNPYIPTPEVTLGP